MKTVKKFLSPKKSKGVFWATEEKHDFQFCLRTMGKVEDYCPQREVNDLAYTNV